MPSVVRIRLKMIELRHFPEMCKNLPPNKSLSKVHGYSASVGLGNAKQNRTKHMDALSNFKAMGWKLYECLKKLQKTQLSNWEIKCTRVCLSNKYL